MRKLKPIPKDAKITYHRVCCVTNTITGEVTKCSKHKSKVKV